MKPSIYLYKKGFYYQTFTKLNNICDTFKLKKGVCVKKVFRRDWLSFHILMKTHVQLESNILYTSHIILTS